MQAKLLWLMRTNVLKDAARKWFVSVRCVHMASGFGLG